MKWYSLKVISGKEKSTKENIIFEAENQNMSQFIEDIFVPYEKVIEMKNNKKKIKEKLFFPGYILINMDLNKETRYLIENINGVLSFVGPKGGAPVPLRDAEIKRIFGEIERKDGKEIIQVSFMKGDSVKIINGPFVDFNGVVDEINEDKQKVKVIVSIFGRPTPVELDFFQVEMYK